MLTRGGEGVKKSENLADIICERSLIIDGFMFGISYLEIVSIFDFLIVSEDGYGISPQRTSNGFESLSYSVKSLSLLKFLIS